MKEAELYINLEDNKLNCQLCSHYCLIEEGSLGFCGVRKNIKGKLFSLNYAKLVAANIDPVEKKPLYHFLPGSYAFSIACAGCNFRCGFCQNWEISQIDLKKAQIGKDISASQVVEKAKQGRCQSIAYTYSEPTIYFEFALEVMRIAKSAGLANIFVTNGYMSEKAIRILRPYLDAANIDLKFFSDESYRKICSAKLNPVLDSIRVLHSLGVWLEITTLIIPGKNDSKKEINDIAGFISDVDNNIPWHVSRFHPDYQFENFQSTPEETIKLAYRAAKAHGLKYVYAGNVDGWGQDTFCPSCAKPLVQRRGSSVVKSHLDANKCGFCAATLAGIF